MTAEQDNMIRTFGNTQAAEVLARLIGNLPERERHRVLSLVTRSLGNCFRAIKLVLDLPDNKVREESVRLWKDKYKEALQQSELLKGYPVIQSYAFNVLVTGVRTLLHPRTPYGLITHGVREAPEKTCDGYFLTGPKIREVTDTRGTTSACGTAV